MKLEFSKHAIDQMTIRDISMDIVMNIVENPDEMKQEEGMSIYQSIVPFFIRW